MCENSRLDQVRVLDSKLQSHGIALNCICHNLCIRSQSPVSKFQASGFCVMAVFTICLSALKPLSANFKAQPFRATAIVTICSSALKALSANCNAIGFRSTAFFTTHTR
eukprot:gnl/MRDRNA2_/MRDRNA2_81804_c0_seq1.p1 gnl/MRDRNA2_/MRDRNA2_81804_c0~~gnl/MRDRNA2_/MRDRNA2_81804_c0_seq1.p1  ORF type:complete len:109 (-),score=6.18 gnl/MRDRNA2_/MRDRNA2_81804_c0_seq1:230-556(-)